MSFQQQQSQNGVFNGNQSTTSHEMIKLQIALVPPNCYPMYTYSNYNMMSAMNPYMSMMNPYAAMMQHQQGFPMIHHGIPMYNTFQQSTQQQPQIQQQQTSQEPGSNFNIFAQTPLQLQQNQVQQHAQQGNSTIEFHPKILTFNVFIDPSNTILELAEVIYTKSLRLYPNLRRQIEILKIKDFEKNDLDVEDLISDNFSDCSRKTVLCIVKNSLDFNKNKSHRFSYIPSEIEVNNNSDIEDEEDDQFDNSDLYTSNNGVYDETHDSRNVSMTQLQLSRKRNISLVYQNKQKVPSLIVQKKRKSTLLSETPHIGNGSFNGNVNESVLPPPVENSPQIRISSNIGETRKRIFSTNLGQSNDAVSRSEEVDPDKRKTIDMVFDENEKREAPEETPSKLSALEFAPKNSPNVNLYDATPNRFNSRVISASNTVIKSQPIPNMMTSVQKHVLSPNLNQNSVATNKQMQSPLNHGKLDSKGAGEPVLQSPGNGILPPRADRIPMKQGLDVVMDASSSDEDVDVNADIINTQQTIGELTPLNVKKNSGAVSVSEESPIRNGENNKSLLEMAKLPNEGEKSADENEENDKMDVEDVSVVLSSLEESTAPTTVIENGRTKRKAALAAAGRMGNKVVRVTDANGKEVLVPYNKVNSFMKNNTSNNLFDSLSHGSDGLKGVNSPITDKINPTDAINTETIAERPKSISPSPVKKPQVINKKKQESNKQQQENDKMEIEKESSSSDSQDSSGSGSDSSSEEEDEEETKIINQKARKVVLDTETTSQRVSSAKQQQDQHKNEKTDMKPSFLAHRAASPTKTPADRLSTLQRMRLHQKTKSLGSLSDLAARGIPPVHDKAAEKRLQLEKKRKEEEEEKQDKIVTEDSQSEDESDSSDSETDSSDDSDSDSSDNGFKPKFIKKPKKKSSNAFASLVKDSKKF
ncbi:hypothetical protein QEN19_003189 [Hanseniaspora menglaensis]